MNNSSLTIPIVPRAVTPWVDRTLRFLAILILPMAYLAGQRIFDLIVRSW